MGSKAFAGIRARQSIEKVGALLAVDHSRSRSYHSFRKGGRSKDSQHGYEQNLILRKPD
jgi:hypothetical protein